MQRLGTSRPIFALAFALVFAGMAAAQDGHLKLDLGSLTSRATQVVNINIDSTTLEWAMESIQAKGGDAQELKDLMKDLAEINVQVLEFDKQNPPAWEELVKAAQGVLKVIDGPQYTPMVSVTDKHGGTSDMVRISLFKDSDGKMGGLTVFVLEPTEIALINLVGRVSLDQLKQLGKALGQPELLNSLTGKPGTSSNAGDK